MNITNLSLYAGSLLACGSLPLDGTAAEAAAIEPPSAAPLYRRWTLGVDAGTTGLGGSLSWRFADHFGARTGFDNLEYSDNGLAIKGLIYSANIRVMSEPLTLDIYPWKEQSFHIGDPSVDLTRTGPPSALRDAALRYEQDQVKEYAEKFKWWPEAKVAVTYSF